MAESRRINILLLSVRVWSGEIINNWENLGHAPNWGDFTGKNLRSSEVGQKFWCLTCPKRPYDTNQESIFRGLISRKMTKRKYKSKGRQLEQWRNSNSVHWQGTLMDLVRHLRPLTNWGKEEYVEYKMLMSKSELEGIHVLPSLSKEWISGMGLPLQVDVVRGIAVKNKQWY